MWLPSTFVVMIVLLNIVIAIMSDVQQKRSAHGRAIIYRTRLSFVIDNWHLVVPCCDVNVPRYLIGVYALRDEEAAV